MRVRGLRRPPTDDSARTGPIALRMLPVPAAGEGAP
ncbi:hypothetical protein SAMN05216252_13916 [Actinacidiphila glaucinigra]|uniref:Uncharacterized protein n=1 Tax=Actinacidiphila glaucinigra TaxID=235986 RepID=A0A239NMC0_9ACTN|nr:hypothetical protein SAMN05216252_13916 [Actinacidiphila glaucinigra]